MPIQAVTTYYLEMRDPRALRPKRPGHIGLEIRQAQVPLPELNRFLYTAVGGNWYWIDRLGWSYAQWQDWVDRPELQTWVAYVTGTPAGYFELEAQAGGDVELAYFGLIPRFVGMGLGGPLLTAAIEQAWRMGARGACAYPHARPSGIVKLSSARLRFTARRPVS
ncbi:MAG: GNAT family N-acetyltransferase [Gammaproteobacteria bacterium]